MMRTSIFSLAMGCVLAFSAPAWAHEDGKGPHGGQIKEFTSKYHMEGVLKDGTVQFYLLDGDAKNSESATVQGGTITVLAKGASPVSSKIEKGSFSEATAPAGTGPLTATIMLKFGSKSRTAKFSFKK